MDRNLGALIAALDPMKHLIILDTNGCLDEEKAKWFADVGAKAQISLTHDWQEHDLLEVRRAHSKELLGH